MLLLSFCSGVIPLPARDASFHHLPCPSTAHSQNNSIIYPLYAHWHFYLLLIFTYTALALWTDSPLIGPVCVLPATRKLHGVGILGLLRHVITAAIAYVPMKQNVFCLLAVDITSSGSPTRTVFVYLVLVVFARSRSAHLCIL